MSNLPTITIDPEEMARIVGEMYEDLGPPGPSDSGLTAREYAEQWDIAYQTAKRRIERLEKAGLLVRGQRYARRSDGHWQAFPVYRPKEEE